MSTFVTTFKLIIFLLLSTTSSYTHSKGSGFIVTVKGISWCLVNMAQIEHILPQGIPSLSTHRGLRHDCHKHILTPISPGTSRKVWAEG